MRQKLPFTIALALSACLPSQPLARDAAGEPDAALDALVPRPPEVLGVVVLVRGGGRWLDVAPQWPTVRVELSHAVEDPPLWLFAGPADEGLLEDLATRPLRVATEARVVPSALEGEGRRWSLTPHARLAPGSIVTVGVGAWLQAGALKMDAPFARELLVSEAPEAGARVTASWPPDGAAAVPIALPSLVVRFDGPVEGVSEGLALMESGGTVPGSGAAAECGDHGFPSGWCAKFTPARALAAGTEHRLIADERVIDATGAPVGPWEARFTTAADGEDAPPSIVALPCALDETELLGACVLADDGQLALRLQIDEPARVALSIAGRTLLAVAPRGSATLVAGDLMPDTEHAALLRVEDLAGQAIEHTLALRTAEPLITLSLAEVRADPRGPEPRQEYVEVLNYGSMTVDLAGLALSDRADAEGDVIMHPQRLAPGQRALIVADAFDPEDPADDRAPPGVPLVRIGTSIGSGGITNAGEPLFLRDASMRRVSAVPALPSAGACIVRAGADPRASDPSLFVIGPCTPGTAP